MPEGGKSRGTLGSAICGCAVDCTCLRLLILAMRRTRLLRNRGSWLLFLQESTALWISPRLPRRQALSSARAQPTVLHSVSYTKRLPLYWSLLQQALGYTQFSVLNSGGNVSTLTDSTSHRMVYSILTRSREYSNAIHCTPLLSCRTTNGVVAGIGPGAALGLTPFPGTFPLFWLIGGPFCAGCCGGPSGPEGGLCSVGPSSNFVLGLLVMACCGCCDGCCIWCWVFWCDMRRFGCDVME